MPKLDSIYRKSKCNTSVEQTWVGRRARASSVRTVHSLAPMARPGWQGRGLTNLQKVVLKWNNKKVRKKHL